jgi:hypothetical protein
VDLICLGFSIPAPQATMPLLPLTSDIDLTGAGFELSGIEKFS